MADIKHNKTIETIDNFTKHLDGLAKGMGAFTKKLKAPNSMLKDADSAYISLSNISSTLQFISKNTGLSKFGKDAGALGKQLGSIVTELSAVAAIDSFATNGTINDSSQQQSLNMIKGLRGQAEIKQEGFLSILGKAAEFLNKETNGAIVGLSAGIKKGIALFDTASSLITGKSDASSVDSAAKSQNRQTAISATGVDKKSADGSVTAQNKDIQARDSLRDPLIDPSIIEGIILIRDSAQIFMSAVANVKDLLGATVGNIAPLIKGLATDLGSSLDIETISNELVKLMPEGVQNMVSSLSHFASSLKGLFGESKGGINTDSKNRDILPSAITQQARNEFGGNVQVEFRNAPPNMKVLNTSSSSDKVSINVDAGYNMLAYI